MAYACQRCEGCFWHQIVEARLETYCVQNSWTTHTLGTWC